MNRKTYLDFVSWFFFFWKSNLDCPSSLNLVSGPSVSLWDHFPEANHFTAPYLNILSILANRILFKSRESDTSLSRETCHFSESPTFVSLQVAREIIPSSEQHRHCAAISKLIRDYQRRRSAGWQRWVSEGPLLSSMTKWGIRKSLKTQDNS